MQIFCFASIPDQWRRIITALIEDKQDPKCEQPKNTSDTKSENPLVFLKNTQTVINNKTQVLKFFPHENRETDLVLISKIIKTAKPKIS